ncbi:MAG: amidohydrolase family protein [Chitinophagaceae bacterium]
MTSRRKFLIQASVTGLGAVLASGLKPFGLPTVQAPDERIIDIHQHTNYVDRTDEQLIAHQRAMGVTTTILLPAGHPVNYGSTHYGLSNGLQAKATPNEACYKIAQLYPKEYLFGANEVPDLPGATNEIEKYLKLGAPIIGEMKFNVECDSREMQKVYELAQAYNVPVIMHWQYNMYNRNFERFHKMLKKYPRVNFIGHAQTWWANIDKNYNEPNVLYPKGSVVAGGLTDRLLSDYHNMYGDLSAGSGLQALTRDEAFTKDFLKRHQDKLLYGSDCADAVGSGTACQGSQTIQAVKKLSPTKEIERKLLFENAKKLMRLKVD